MELRGAHPEDGSTLRKYWGGRNVMPAIPYVSIFKRFWWIVILGVVASYASAQESPSGQPAVVSQMEKVEGTIESINPTTREVVLRGAKGAVSVVVGAEAKNFDKLHVGDKVSVTYYQGIAAQMSKGDKKVKEPASSTFAYRAGGGAKPGGGVGQSVTAMVTIEDVDPTSNTVAFRSADGTVHVVTARSPQMQQFVQTLKRGDKVDVTYTESIAVNVTPTGK
jgi:hypothetical protein